ncbi:MAG: type VI secretion system Vgr family protein [Azoarcus sp.]|jgi:type VI secretion system secreted protein VgrG|nr:type VI secretion system Vgr family protein [Azoarcus sp.]
MDIRKIASFANAFAQNNRLIKLRLGDGRRHARQLLPQTLIGKEALSAPYHHEVICLSTHAALEPESFLGLPAQIGILTAHADGLDIGEQETEIIRCGIVTGIDTLPSDGDFTKYKLSIEPPFALLRHRHTSRVFQDISVPGIVKTILDEHLATNPAFTKTFAHRFELTQTYPERPYCLQYCETDLAFVERLLAEEGIAYRFEHTGGPTDASKRPNRYEDNAEEKAETLIPLVTFVAFDDPYSLPQATQGKIHFHHADATEEADSLTGWQGMRRLGVRQSALVSLDDKTVITHIGTDENLHSHGSYAFAPSESRAAKAESTLEDDDLQTLYYGTDGGELTRTARLRQAVRDRQKSVLHGEGNVRQIKAGEWFELTGHPADDGNGRQQKDKNKKFAVLSLKFTAHDSLPGDLSRFLDPKAESAPPPPYRMQIEAQPRGVSLSPAFSHTRHAKPTSQGIQTATVVGPEGKDVFTDAMGRIKIQFHWPRPKEHPAHSDIGGVAFDERSSCWMRAVYPGAGRGYQFIPRIGQKVLIDFLEGDIDRPIVTHVIYDGAHPPPCFSSTGQLSANKTLSGIKTKEYPGDQDNELLFDATQNEVRTKRSAEHGKAQLNQGFLTHPRQDGAAEPRGEEFELRTDRHGALHADEGLLINADPQPWAQGKQPSSTPPDTAPKNSRTPRSAKRPTLPKSVRR